MAAYAALVSLINIIDQIRNHPRLSISLDKNQVGSLQEKVGFLLDFIETDSHGVISEDIQVIESQIASAAYTAEDVIESHVVDQIHVTSTSLLNLKTVIEDMDLVKEKVMAFKGKDAQATYQGSALTSSISRVEKMVGFDNELLQLMGRLTAHQSDRQIIPVVGMGGTGKTTLARNAYEHLLVVQRFDIRAWVTVSQKQSVGGILLQLLSRPNSGEIKSKTDEQLGEELYKKLWGRRYLVVVDDIWSVEAWDKVKRFFPDNSNASRIVVTTRITDVAIHFDSACLELNLLNEDKSWDLFCDKAFGQAVCPSELEDIGKSIAKKCKGLPLSIVVIAGLLGRSCRTPEYWQSIARDIISILTNDDDNCLNILSLSYVHLPAHLKPCFLYMGVFPEDKVIRFSRVIKLWVAEGFIKPDKAQTPEETARGYLNDLVDRNLILKHKLGSSGRIRHCKIHDLLRELCLKVGQRDMFLCTTRDIMDRERRIVFLHEKEDYYYDSGLAVSPARTLVMRTDRFQQLPFNSRLLRVLDVYDGSMAQGIDLSKDTYDQLVNLRYLCYVPYDSITHELPWSMSSLVWNMQTLIIGGEYDAPPEIWEMRQLRHLDVSYLHLPDPQQGDNDVVVLHNLQTLKTVINFKLSEEVCGRVLNVKKLNMQYDEELDDSNDYCLYNLDRLSKLESLTLQTVVLRVDLQRSIRTFPSSLKKLCLMFCNLLWEDLTRIACLPHLEVLKLRYYKVEGQEWNPVEGEFVSLKFLLLECGNLVRWNAERSHFPVLESLVLEELGILEEIPLDIGEIATLRLIRVACCSESVAISAMKIVEEQESFGNEGLQVRVEFQNKAKLERFREQVEQSNNYFTSSNLILTCGN